MLKKLPGVSDDMKLETVVREAYPEAGAGRDVFYVKFLGHPVLQPFASYPVAQEPATGFDVNKSLALLPATALHYDADHTMDFIAYPHPLYGRNLELLQLTGLRGRFILYRSLEGLEEHLIIDDHVLTSESLQALEHLARVPGYEAAGARAQSIERGRAAFLTGEPPRSTDLAHGFLFDAALANAPRDHRGFLAWATAFLEANRG